MSVQITVPIAEVDAHPHMAVELATGNFSQETKRTLSRVYTALRSEGATLANGAVIASTDHVLEYLIELVTAAEAE